MRHYRLLVLNGRRGGVRGRGHPHGYVNAVEALHRALDRRDQTVSPGDVVRPDVDRPVPVTERGREI